mmetsp:Transcript_34001/g.58386  ORF Transcript_34001/g.58386 Transcript_34001/m.58386 type:complete len:362 (-) Transcript_34001:281-1366(-)
MTDAGAVSKKGTQASNSTCAPIIRKWDSHAEAMIDESTATAFGGTMTLFGYIIMFVWTIWYIAGIYDPAGDNISSTTTIVNFPTNEDGCHGEGEEACSLTLPRMTCIAEGGCWARFMKAYGDSGKWCVFVAEDDEFPDFAREIYQTPDPTDQMTVLWNKYDTGNNDINFGVSYDRVRVTNKLTGETETIEAGGTSSIYSSKIYQGATIMSLSRTSGAGDWLQGAAKYAVDSWTNLVISRDGSDVSSDNLCCMSSNEGSILDVDGNVVTDDSYLTDCTDFTEVRIAPMPTYPHERVSEWAWVSDCFVRASPPLDPRLHLSISPPACLPYMTRASAPRNPHLPNHFVPIATNPVPLRRVRWYA